MTTPALITPELPEPLTDARCIWQAGACLGEGPVWSDRQQALYWTDIHAGKLHRHTPDNGSQQSWQFDEEICAVAEREQGGLIITLASGFAFFDPDSGKLTRLHSPEPDKPGNRFNDGKCDAAGRFWAGSMDRACTEASGALYRYDPDGRCHKLDTGYIISNGPSFSPDGRTLYHHESKLGVIYAFDLDMATGAISQRRCFARLAPALGGPDGSTTDREGRLWLALFGGSHVIRIRQDGQVDACIHLPCSLVTSCCFGGPDFDILFITTASFKLTPAQRAKQPLAGGLFAAHLPGAGGCAAARFAG